ncbi:MFS transporter [Nitrincola sp. MINF-07-Sa-05]|uniref:MFS transporter n=1 Tax=Nitrincola salilacus TaxID=3400273 RepID=UPI003917F28D
MKHSERAIVLSLLLSYFSWGVFWGAWGVLLPQFKYDLALSDAALGYALTGISIGAIAAMVLGGRLVKTSPAKALMVLLCAFACAVLLLGNASGFASLAGFLVVLGMMSGLLDIALNVNVSNAEKAFGRSLFQRAHGVFPLGVILAAPIVGVARDMNIYTDIILFVVAAFMVPPLALFYASSRHVSAMSREETSASNDGQALLRWSVPGAFAGISGIFALIVIFLFLENAVEQWSTLFVEQNLNSTATVASLTPSLYMAAIFVGRMAADRWEHVITIERTLHWGTIGTAAGFTLMAFSTSIYLTLALAAIMGLLVAPIVPSLYSWISTNVADDRRTTVLSFVTTLSYLGYLLSPVFVGSVASHAFGLRTAWFALGLVALVAYVLSRILRNTIMSRTGGGTL